MKTLIINIGLSIVAVSLASVFFPVGFFYGIIRSATKKECAKYFFVIAISIDQLGNVVLQYLLNDTMIKKGGAKFGNEDTTVSGILGRNQKKGTLTKFGKAINWILNKLETDHSILSIEEGEETETK